MTSKQEHYRTVIELSTTNRDEWYVSLRATVVPMGREHASIINDRKLPESELPAPHIDDFHVDQDGREITEAPKYKSVVKDDQGKPVRNAAGALTYESTMVHYEALEKAKSVRRIDTIRLAKITSAVAVIIMQSIPERNRNLLSTIDQDRYERAQSDPAELLNMIDETHQPKDDSHMINVLTDFIECKQSQFPNNDFLSFITEHSKLQRKFCTKLNPARANDTNVALEAICKSILLINSDNEVFRYIKDGMKTGELNLSYTRLVDKMTTYIQNSAITVNERQLVASGKRPSKVKPRADKDKNEIAAVSIGAVDSTCGCCGKNMPSALDARTGLPFVDCRACNLKNNQVPARSRKDPTNPGKPNLSRAFLQTEYNKNLARISRKEKEREAAVSEATATPSRSRNSKLVNPPLAKQTSEIARELERSAQKKALIMSILDTDESEESD
jgi:hypothetical protein